MNIKVENFSQHSFKGWVRTNVDFDIPTLSGRTASGVKFVKGPKSGKDTNLLDIYLELNPREQSTINFANHTTEVFQLAPLPTDLQDFFGGWPSIKGNSLIAKEITIEGAAIKGWFECRVGNMFHINLWLLWYPDSPFVAKGEIAITASNPNTQAMSDTVPSDFRLSFGNGMTYVPGRQVNAPLIESGVKIGDGQSIVLPICIFWPTKVNSAADWAHVENIGNLLVAADGIQNLLPHGNPQYPANYPVRNWINNGYQESVRRLHTFETPFCGPFLLSTSTGAQEDQVFVRGESNLPDGVGAVIVTYLNAIQLSKRPCHHLEFNGNQVDKLNHPNLMFWDGRAHYISQDKLGKPTGYVDYTELFKNWYGPDVEHWLYNTLAAASRLTGSPACQWLLEMQARIYELQWTWKPGLSTSQMYASRSIGWEGIMAVHLWRNLKDRSLAERVKDNYVKRMTLVCIPKFQSSPEGIWDFREDPRLGSGWRWAAWQHSIGSYGLWLGCNEFGIEAGKVEALRTAKACLTHSWIKRTGESFYRDVVNVPYTHIGKGQNDPYSPVPIELYNTINPWSQVNWFETTWNIPSLAVVKKFEPNNPKLLEIMAQLRSYNITDFHWFTPEFTL